MPRARRWADRDRDAAAAASSGVDGEGDDAEGDEGAAAVRSRTACRLPAACLGGEVVAAEQPFADVRTSAAGDLVRPRSFASLMARVVGSVPRRQASVISSARRAA
ncbi:hypothetical protein [Streptomyces plumbiresistens]|uniref:hypothetical protein n=1 Tax=Streptomyces plumbiresistens TaxID=511811 RepID=UPI0031E9805D